MVNKIFDPKKLSKLNNPGRLEKVPPKLIWEKLKLGSSKVLIDIGAGPGFYSKEFLQLSDNGKVYACDISDIMLDWIKDNLSDRYPNIIPVKMKDDDVPLESGIADLVYMMNLHHEIENHSKMLSEVKRLLKPEGKLFIVDWKKEKMDQGPPYDIRFSTDDVKKQLIDSRFQNIIVYNELEKHFLIIAQV